MIKEPPNISPPGKDRPTPAWANWFASVFRVCASVVQSGTTANRPTENLWIGRMYYDTTLSKPIWVNAVTPSVVWKDAAGTTV